MLYMSAELARGGIEDYREMAAYAKSDEMAQSWCIVDKRRENADRCTRSGNKKQRIRVNARLRMIGGMIVGIFPLDWGTFW